MRPDSGPLIRIAPRKAPWVPVAIAQMVDSVSNGTWSTPFQDCLILDILNR